MTTQLTQKNTVFDDEQKEVIKEAFNLYAKHDHQLAIKDITLAFRYLTGKTFASQMNQLTQEAIQAGAKYKEGVGVLIDFDTFCVLLGRRMRNNVGDVMKEVFKRFDVSNTGYVGEMELRYMFKAMGESLSETEIKQLLAEVDKDRDLRLSYEEFELLMEKLGQKNRDL